MSHNLAKLASISLIGGLIGRGLRYGLNVVLARKFGAEILGLFAFGLVVLSVGSLVARVGLDHAAQKYVSIYRSEEQSAVVGTTIFCLLVPTLVGTGLALFLATNAGMIATITSDEFGRVVRLFSIGIPLFAVMMVGMAATRGLQETKYSVYIRDFGQSGTALLFLFITAHISTTISAAIHAYLLSLIVGIGLMLYYLRRQGALTFSVEYEFQSRELLSFSVPLVLVSTLQYAISWTDILVLSLFETTVQIGYYQVAFQTSVLLLVVLHAVNSIFPSIVAEKANDGDFSSIERYYEAITKWITSFTLFGCAFLFMFTDSILLVFGSEFASANLPLLVLAVGHLFVALAGPAGNVLSMSGYERLELVNTVSVATLNLVLNYVLIQEFGITGAAVATGLSLVVLNVLRLAEIQLLLKINPYSMRYFVGFLPTVVAVPVMYVWTISPVTGLLQIMIAGVSSLCVFSAVVLFVGFDDIDSELFRSLKSSEERVES